MGIYTRCIDKRNVVTKAVMCLKSWVRACFVVSLLVLASTARAADATPTSTSRPSPRVVRTKYGQLRGKIITLGSRFGTHLPSVEAFMGVPYVSPPLGTLRFMPPVNSPHWDDVRAADTPGPACPQRLPEFLRNESSPAAVRMPPGRLEQLRRLARAALLNTSEDCLHLNIYTPASVARDPTKLPVIMFIHGESYEWNSGNAYDGSVLASYGNVVVVTINYRLGILGFLPAMDGASRANNGLLDQIAALHWIHENIDVFGGDHRNVTILGHGHGAACVNFLMMSPMAKDNGLFQRAVMMSGSALSPWAIARDAVRYARHVGRALGCPESGTGAALGDCLRHRPVRELVDVPLAVPEHLSAFGPTVDGTVVPGEPRHEMASPRSSYADYDLLFGVVRFEAYFLFTAYEEKHGFEVDRRDRLLRTLVRNLYSFHQQEIFLTVVNEYTDWTRSVQHPASILEETAEALSDALVVAPVVEAGTLHAAAGAARKAAKQQQGGGSKVGGRVPTTHFYLFGYHSDESSFAQKNGCVHGEDLPYVLGLPLLGSGAPLYGNYSKQEATLSETTMAYWVRFFRTGSPNFTTTETESERSKGGRGEKVGWPAYDPVHQKYLTLGTKSKVRDHYHAHRLSVWTQLIPKLHRAGGGDVPRSHHLLEDFENVASYDGVVREVPPPPPPMSPSPTPSLPHSTMDSNSGGGGPLTTSGGARAGKGAQDGGRGGVTTPGDPSQTEAMAMPQGGYSTALGVTIAVGCSLLILNVLIFAGVYYQRDKAGRATDKSKKRPFEPPRLGDELGRGSPPSQPASILAGSGTLKRPPPASPCAGGCEHLDYQSAPAVVTGCLAVAPPKVPPKPNSLLPSDHPEAQPLLPLSASARVLSPGAHATLMRHHQHQQQQQQQQQQQTQQVTGHNTQELCV
ncbi:neuroligin-4, Y-linked-like isoform X2 [Dermacentor albipictus]